MLCFNIMVKVCLFYHLGLESQYRYTRELAPYIGLSHIDGSFLHFDCRKLFGKRWSITGYTLLLIVVDLELISSAGLLVVDSGQKG